MFNEELLKKTIIRLKKIKAPFVVVEIPDDIEDLDDFVWEYVTAVDLGTSTNQRTKIN